MRSHRWQPYNGLAVAANHCWRLSLPLPFVLLLLSFLCSLGLQGCFFVGSEKQDADGPMEVKAKKHAKEKHNDASAGKTDMIDQAARDGWQPSAEGDWREGGCQVLMVTEGSQSFKKNHVLKCNQLEDSKDMLGVLDRCKKECVRNQNAAACELWWKTGDDKCGCWVIEAETVQVAQEFVNDEYKQKAPAETESEGKEACLKIENPVAKRFEATRYEIQVRNGQTPDRDGDTALVKELAETTNLAAANPFEEKTEKQLEQQEEQRDEQLLVYAKPERLGRQIQQAKTTTLAADKQLEEKREQEQDSMSPAQTSSEDGQSDATMLTTTTTTERRTREVVHKEDAIKHCRRHRTREACDGNGGCVWNKDECKLRCRTAPDCTRWSSKSQHPPGDHKVPCHCPSGSRLIVNKSQSERTCYACKYPDAGSVVQAGDSMNSEPLHYVEPSDDVLSTHVLRRSRKGKMHHSPRFAAYARSRFGGVNGHPMELVQVGDRGNGLHMRKHLSSTHLRHLHHDRSRSALSDVDA